MIIYTAPHDLREAFYQFYIRSVNRLTLLMRHSFKCVGMKSNVIAKRTQNRSYDSLIIPSKYNERIAFIQI